jgi:hypothetical protein
MKKILTLLTLALLMSITVSAYAGDWTFSGWAHTENTVGESISSWDNTNADYLKTGDSHEYALEFRLTASTIVDDMTSITYQLRTLGYYDNAGWKATNNGDGVGTRLAYVTYSPTKDLSFIIGKNAYWLAGGLLMDDFARGVSMNYKIADNLSLFGLAGRYESNLDEQLYAAALNGNFGGLDLGLTAFGSSDTIQSGAKSLANTSGKGYDGTLIYALNAGYNILPGLNLSAAYAINSKAESDWKTAQDKDENQALKVQLAYSGIKNTGLYLQYFKQDAFMMWPVETGDHMGWWSDMYSAPTGITGVRLIGEVKLTNHLNLTAAYGSYKLNDSSYNDDTLTKGTIELSMNF